MKSHSLQDKAKHLPAIDALRALAVAGVLLYHLGVSWIPGGFLGVDVFFVISGYVITRTIIDLVNRDGVFDLRKFYAARFRRLAPALIGLLIGTSFLILLVARDAAFRFMCDLPFVLLGVNNWRLIYLHQDYFSHIGRAPLLQHTWTLSVEMQFYLLWPMLLHFIWKRWGKNRISPIALFLAISSGGTLLALSLSRGGTATSSHIYFGSDSHSIGLFLGAALAVSWIPENLSQDVSDRAQRVIDSCIAIGLLGIISCYLFIKESDSLLYTLAFPIASIATTLAIAGLVHPSSRITDLLHSKVLLWIGERSYGIYLWHWVIFNVTRPNIDVTGPSLSLNLVRILIVLAIADLSYRLLELPVRNHQFQNWWRGLKYRLPQERKRKNIIFYSSITTLFTLSAASLAVANATSHIVILGANAQGSFIETNTLKNVSNPDPLDQGVWLTGDSIILGIRNSMTQSYKLSVINARVGRQIGELIDVVSQDKSLAHNSPVVMDVGNNNILNRADLVTLLNEVKSQPWIVLVNTAVPRTYRASNDAMIEDVAAQYPNVKLVDWYQISLGHPEYFAPDGVHLVQKGVYAYQGAINEAISQLEKPFRA
jgi:peptidoglycan/LPS O-acetylase OafA/YrhL